MHPKHLKLLAGLADLYRYLITFALTQHGPAQRGLTADDLNEFSAVEQLHAAAVRADKKQLLLVVAIDQTDQRPELYALAGVVGVRAELAPMGNRLADGLGATGLACGQIGGLKTQCVVFVFGDIFFVRRRFMGRQRRLFGLQQVLCESFQHLLLQPQFIHSEKSVSQTSVKGNVLIMKGCARFECGSERRLFMRFLAAATLALWGKLGLSNGVEK